MVQNETKILIQKQKIFYIPDQLQLRQPPRKSEHKTKKIKCLNNFAVEERRALCKYGNIPKDLTRK